MFLDFHRTSVGRFAVMADVVGSMGEKACIQVGRFHKTPKAAIEAAQRLHTSKNFDYVVVVDRASKWRRTVVAAGRVVV